MELEKSLNDRIQTAYEQTFDLLYDEQGCVKSKTGLDPGAENVLWDFNEGIGAYVERVLSGRMSINEIEIWVADIEKTIKSIKQ